MPLLAKLMAGLFTLLFSVFGRFFVMEKAFKLAAMTSMLILTTALWTAAMSCASGVCGQAISGISSAHHGFAVGLGIAFNGVTYSAVSCYLTVWTLCQLYVIKKRMITMVSK